ncbi:hypothetical protein GCM10010339_18120 [Streptomyces alanosinicus]|uniref:NarG-like domain-containing protein n=1 Tax=Streptomyces alanosinicus TaxID=68171 RepID=A0A919D177_9ACTN|nr:hypothetical protein GCM10010339_18120 [Streptomyces alanosinicus]
MRGPEGRRRSTASAEARAAARCAAGALDPDVGVMAHAPLVHRLHALFALALFALWPFGRLVHAFAVPLGYAVRPYVVYRSRGGAVARGSVMDR